jgi:hypothetical protein
VYPLQLKIEEYIMYSEKVNFPGEDDVYTVEEFKEMCECGGFIDYDGFGYPVKDSLADENITVFPSKLNKIPLDATHIVWYNR